MADFPLTYAAIKEKVEYFNDILDLYWANPAKWAEQHTSSITISIPEYIKQLTAQRDYWVDRLQTFPWFEDSDMEGTQ